MMHSEVSVLLRFLPAILALRRLCSGDLLEFISAPGWSPSSPEAGRSALGGDSAELGAVLLSEPSLPVSAP